MNKVIIPITSISYLNSGRGHPSLSFRNGVPAREMIDFLYPDLFKKLSAVVIGQPLNF